MNALQADSARARLGEILEHSRAMSAAADRGEWETLVAMEACRRQALDALFAMDGIMQVSGIPDGVRELLDIDRHLITRSEAMRRQASDEFGQIDQGRRAVRAYHASVTG